MDIDLTKELHALLDRTADRLVADGTHTESRTLLAMAEAARELRPGAAAALVDWNGPEVVRLRAFGIVHGVLLYELPTHAQQHLLARLHEGFSDLLLTGSLR